MGLCIPKTCNSFSINELGDNYCLTDASRKYFLFGKTVKTTRLWLKKQLESSSAADRVLVVNGMIKTGKTTFVNEILPRLIHSHSKIFKKVLVLKLDCEDFDMHSPGEFVCLILKRLARFMDDLKINIPFHVKKDIELGGRPPGYYLDSLQACVKEISRVKHFFIIIDEVQKWFIWSKDNCIDYEAAKEMSNVFRQFLLIIGLEKLHFVITGSAMGTAFVNIVQYFGNSKLLTECMVVSLPDKAPSELWKVFLQHLKEKHTEDLSANIIERISIHCENNLAFTVYLVELFARKNLESAFLSDPDAIENFCLTQTSNKIVLELWENTKYTLNSMNCSERKIFFQLVSDGVKEKDIPEGWKEHLKYYLKTARSDSNNFVIESLPFKAFVLKFVSREGKLLHTVDQEKLNVDKELKFCHFFKVMVVFGEECSKRGEKANADYVQNGLQYLFNKLKQKGILTAEDLKKTAFVLQIVELDNARTSSFKKLDVILKNKNQFTQVLQSVLISLRHLLVHEVRSNLEKLLEIMENCPFDFWDAIPHLT